MSRALPRARCGQLRPDLIGDGAPLLAGSFGSHSGDVPYWLRTRDSLNLFRQTRIWEPGNLSLEAEMAQALLNFARGRVPIGPRVGAWPRFDSAARRLVWLGLESKAIDWPHFADMRRFGQAESERRTEAKPRD